ncbi:NADAR family protein [Bacteriovorax sp. Seq25_V]|uniref:NADAR family protein n=1 Tax=Bacteriovorax sp. Seq25_V TaxID=1201288 RepID=UPI000389E730|nr:NADAR family protein [Bacteriovorax sp. Seq25_V]EQC44028.1 swarming motility protein YbiA family protein [Bacteriovorax sp. Seq25_V]
MKNLIKICTLTFISLVTFAGSIPHYDRYPQTPAIPYEEDILDFYSTKTAYGEFSNFALFPITINGVLWPTSEHYYQAHKYEAADLQEWVRQAPSPYEAAMRGRDKNIPKRADWDSYKDIAMDVAVRAKFTQYEVLKELLLSTNDSEIFEHTKNDCYWGDCGDRTGKNKLGKLLMTIRAEL